MNKTNEKYILTDPDIRKYIANFTLYSVDKVTRFLPVFVDTIFTGAD